MSSLFCIYIYRYLDCVMTRSEVRPVTTWSCYKNIIICNTYPIISHVHRLQAHTNLFYKQGMIPIVLFDNLDLCLLQWAVITYSNNQQSLTEFNQHFDFLEPICSTCPQIECLVTEGNYRIPDEISICVRWRDQRFYAMICWKFHKFY